MPQKKPFLLTESGYYYYVPINIMSLFLRKLELKTNLYLFKVWILKGKFTDDYFIFFFINNRDGAVIIFFKNVPVKKRKLKI